MHYTTEIQDVRISRKTIIKNEPNYEPKNSYLSNSSFKSSKVGIAFEYPKLLIAFVKVE